MKKRIGIFIGRMNPPHKGHIQTILTSLKDNDITLIFLGSSNIINQHNPFSYSQRVQFLYSYFSENVIIDSLKDVASDKQWVGLIGEKIGKYSEKGYSEICFYGGDFENDYAINVLQKYEYTLGLPNITYQEIGRNNLKIEHESQEIVLSSTLLRTALKEKNMGLVRNMMEENIYNELLKVI